MVCLSATSPYRELMRQAPGGKDLEEIELTHLDGHKGSKPVRYVSRHPPHV
jgi:hypothetical protein